MSSEDTGGQGCSMSTGEDGGGQEERRKCNNCMRTQVGKKGEVGWERGRTEGGRRALRRIKKG